MADVYTLEDAPFRVRGWKGGKVVVDGVPRFGRRAKAPIAWMFPRASVDLPADAIAGEQDGFVHVKWDAVDEWWEEDERVLGSHPRDPRHRVDVRQSSRPIVVRAQGVLVAESRRPALVAETDLPLRYYLPRADVRFELLVRSDRTSWCPYKGLASYYDIVGEGVERRGALWSYEAPLADAPPLLAGLIGIWAEKLEVEI